MSQAAQDAGVGRFEHILLCSYSMAEATVQTLPVRNCVVCSLSVPLALMLEKLLPTLVTN